MVLDMHTAPTRYGAKSTAFILLFVMDWVQWFVTSTVGRLLIEYSYCLLISKKFNSSDPKRGIHGLIRIQTANY